MKKVVSGRNRNTVQTVIAYAEMKTAMQDTNSQKYTKQGRGKEKKNFQDVINITSVKTVANCWIVRKEVKLNMFVMNGCVSAVKNMW